MLLLFLLPLLSQFWVLLVEAALFRDKNPRVGCLRAQHMVKLSVMLRESQTAFSKVVTAQELLPRDGFGCPERPRGGTSSRQIALQALGAMRDVEMAQTQ